MCQLKEEVGVHLTDALNALDSLKQSRCALFFDVKLFLFELVSMVPYLRNVKMKVKSRRPNLFITGIIDKVTNIF